MITIEDDGRGLSEGAKEKLFVRGYRAGEDVGSGLGMYLVQQIVENYGGSIEVKDSEMGGLRFDVRLKKA